MAYWQKRGPKKDKVYVYQYSRTAHKPLPLPRESTEHLDGKSDAEIERWVRQWEADNGIVQQNRGRRKDVVNITPKLKRLLEAYQKERAAEEGVGEGQLLNERTHFYKHIFKFFIEIHGRNDPIRWGDVGGGFRAWLTETTTMDAKSRKAVILTLNRFGRYLKDIGELKEPWHFKTPKLGHRRTTRTTPLPRAVRPNEVLREAIKLRILHPNWALALLLGYFGPLRPEETFVLAKEDFLTGREAVRHSQTYDRLLKAGLGTKLAVHIYRAHNPESKPKNFNSNGIVTIWSRRAAIVIARILKDWPAKTQFFLNKKTKKVYSKSHLFRTYDGDFGSLLGVTLHDLRRASALYLGRTKGIEPFLLQDILRHADLDTMMLYTRRPTAEEDASARQQDFEDVV